MREIVCAVCRKKTSVRIVYPANLIEHKISPLTYSSRRIPDKVHFRIVVCTRCGLLFSTPIFEETGILDLYKESNVPLMADIQNSKQVYGLYLTQILDKLPGMERLLEIGCGNGFFLEEAKRMGFGEVWGVEPSSQSVRFLPKGIDKKHIVIEIFKEGQFKKNFFDIVCFFQVFDHLTDPKSFLKEVYTILKPGGYVLAIMHDAKAWTHKILGESSPIFDIQHIYLFDKKSAKKIFENNGFHVGQIFNTFSKYSLGYWLKMAPLPGLVRSFVMKHDDWKLFKIRVPLKVGNMAVVARKD